MPSTPNLTLEHLLCDYAENDYRKFDIFFRRMRGTYPDDCLKACLRHLGHHPASTPASRQISLWLTSSVDYVPVLVDPLLMAAPATEKASLALRDADPQFFTKLARFLQDLRQPKTIALILRVLQLIPAFGECGILIPWLRSLDDNNDEQVRLQSAKTLCELRPTRVMVERQLQSSEPQTRADALEALWRVPGSEAKAVFRFALTDNDGRVVAKALVGLHLNHDSTAVDRMIELTNHRSAIARLAAVAAIVKAEDRRCAPALQKLTGDVSQAVREAATVALSCLPPAEPEVVRAQPEPEASAPPSAPEPAPSSKIFFETPAFRLL